MISFLCLAGILILAWAGWFPSLPVDLRIPRPTLLAGLTMAVLLTMVDPVPLGSLAELHPGFLAPAGLWFFLLTAERSEMRFKLFHLSLLIGFILFFWHEAAHVDTAWEQGSFRLMSVLAAGCVPLFAFEGLARRVTVAVGSLLVSHLWILLFHREVLTPPVIGVAEFLDTVWISLGALVFLHYSGRFVRYRFRKRRGIESV
jgi:hypothetical protein